MQASELAKICDIQPHRVILYGYTFERKTVIVYYDGENIVREDDGERWMVIQDQGVYPSLFYLDIKRWYAGATNPKFRDLYNALSYNALCETVGGEHMFNAEV